jgi:hypothetical protein
MPASWHLPDVGNWRGINSAAAERTLSAANTAEMQQAVVALIRVVRRASKLRGLSFSRYAGRGTAITSMASSDQAAWVPG